MAGTGVVEQVRQAWQQQREGNSSAALAAFAQIVEEHPGNIDARYGLGLAQKVVGNRDEAVGSFRRALELVSGEQEAEDARHNDDDRIRSPEDDRLTMLARMLNQRIVEIEGGG